jgi:hypothetical protein
MCVVDRREDEQSMRIKMENRCGKNASRHDGAVIPLVNRDHVQSHWQWYNGQTVFNVKRDALNQRQNLRSQYGGCI